MGKLIRNGDPFSLFPSTPSDRPENPAVDEPAPEAPRGPVPADSLRATMTRATRWAMRDERLLKRSYGRPPRTRAWDPHKPFDWRRPFHDPSAHPPSA